MKQLLILLMCTSVFACKQDKGKVKEIVYHPRNLKEIKRNLEGNWLDTTQRQEDPKHPYFWNFIFLGADYGRFQDVKKDGDSFITPTCASAFAIHYEDRTWQIYFRDFFSRKPTKRRVIKISNQRLVLSDSLTTKTYLKIP